MGDTCIVNILTCAKAVEKEELLRLQSLATTQLNSNKSEFEEPISWGFDFCEVLPKAIHFVASTESIICGWAILDPANYYGLKTMEIAAITTRRKRMGEQRIGKMIHDSIINYASEHKYDLVFLHAKDESVAAIYKKWGYHLVFQPEEIRDTSLPTSISDESKGEEFKRQMALMMYYSIDKPILLSDAFKTMIKKDSENMALKGYYGNDRPKEGGLRKRKHTRRRITRGKKRRTIKR